MINIIERTANGVALHTNLPEPTQITVPKIRKAVEHVVDRHALLVEVRRNRNAAERAIIDAKSEVERVAAEAMIAEGKVPKGIRKAVKQAKEDHDDLEVEAVAAEAAFVDAYRKLVAVIEANAAEWRTIVLKDAERALNLIAAARKTLEQADAEATIAFGVLGMLHAGDEAGAVRPVLSDTPQKVYVGLALEPLSDAIGQTNAKLEAYRRG